MQRAAVGGTAGGRAGGRLLQAAAALHRWVGDGGSVGICSRQPRFQQPRWPPSDPPSQVRGYGLSGDAHHITQPPPDGLGAQLAMQRALRQAGVAPGEVCYINAHATSTPQGTAAFPAAAHMCLMTLLLCWAAPCCWRWPECRACLLLAGPAMRQRRKPKCVALPVCYRPAGDDIEQRAIAAVFGEAATSAARAGGQPPLAVSSTKGATGHLLGAAGAVEAIFSLLALASGTAPATANLAAPDPPLLAGLVAGVPARLPAGPRAVLSNSFGFGGTNAALVFTSPPQA